MTIAEETRALLEQAGALKRGHFILSSGLHSDRYCQCATLFERPEIAARVAALMKHLIPSTTKVDVVLSPALGGVLWGYELARVLGCRNIFAERPSGATGSGVGRGGAPDAFGAPATADCARRLAALAVAPGAERFVLRRGFELHRGERVLLAEDVVTTGGSVNELVPLVEAAGAVVVGFAVIADRSRGAFRPPAGSPLFALTTLDFETWKADELPSHLIHVPAVKPGSRVALGGATP